MDQKYSAFIFARGGSKGVINKNIRIVAGKPLIIHTIESALASRYIKRIIVSTDSEKIAKISSDFGAEILMRPAEISGDNSPEILAWKHAINNYSESLNGIFISLPATSPLRAIEDIDKGIDKFNKTDCDILFGVTPSHRSPYLNMAKINKSDLLEIIIPNSTATRRQDVPQVYDITTCIYVSNVKYIKHCANLMDGRVSYTCIPVERSIDIDTEFDLHLAELMLENPYQ